ncbi:hypothetical protein SESBI_18466 [Sesbania bispinosa]|nr:hypothetical protein SESBI_18466 [Sesbania bispinosa]
MAKLKQHEKKAQSSHPQSTNARLTKVIRAQEAHPSSEVVAKESHIENQNRKLEEQEILVQISSMGRQAWQNHLARKEDALILDNFVLGRDEEALQFLNQVKHGPKSEGIPSKPPKRSSNIQLKSVSEESARPMQVDDSFHQKGYKPCWSLLSLIL